MMSIIDPYVLTPVMFGIDPYHRPLCPGDRGLSGIGVYPLGVGVYLLGVGVYLLGIGVYHMRIGVYRLGMGSIPCG